MTNTATETLAVVVERQIPFAPEKIWRALTQPHLIEEWLMKNDFKPVVTWTLTPTSTGTNLRMEHSGFRPDRPQNYQGAKYGWRQFFANLEQILARID
jgi:uncharacterized protein YndB with AHSA1/START domain